MTSETKSKEIIKLIECSCGHKGHPDWVRKDKDGNLLCYMCFKQYLLDNNLEFSPEDLERKKQEPKVNLKVEETIEIKEKSKKKSSKKKPEQKLITDLYESKVQSFPIDLILPNSWNTNMMSDEEFESLKNSIKTTNGKYLYENPIKIRKLENDEKYEIIDGEHRWEGCKEIGIESIPAEIIEIDTKKAKRLNVIFSMNRGNIDYFKLSKLLNEEYWDENGKKKCKQEKLAEEFGFSGKKFINKILKIYQRLNIFYEKVVLTRLFENEHLIELARVKNDHLREKLIDKTIENKWTSNTIRTRATIFNEITTYLKELTEDSKIREDILGKIEDETLFNFDASALKNEINALYKKEQNARIICGDMFEVLDNLDMEFDCLLTDPPYALSILSSGRKFSMSDQKELDQNKGEWDKFTKEEYIEFSRKWIRKVNKHLKNGASLFIFSPDRFIESWDLILKETDLEFKSSIVWHKSNPAPHIMKNNLVSSVEYIIYATKGKPTTFNWLGQNEMHNMIECAKPVSANSFDHPTQKPVKLIEKLLRISTNTSDLILDPFAGTGSTAKACENLGRGWVMIDIEEKWTKIIERRIQNN